MRDCPKKSVSYSHLDVLPTHPDEVVGHHSQSVLLRFLVFIDHESIRVFQPFLLLPCFINKLPYRRTRTHVRSCDLGVLQCQAYHALHHFCAYILLHQYRDSLRGPHYRSQEVEYRASEIIEVHLRSGEPEVRSG